MKVYCHCSIEEIVTSAWMNKEDFMKDVKLGMGIGRYKSIERESKKNRYFLASMAQWLMIDL